MGLHAPANILRQEQMTEISQIDILLQIHQVSFTETQLHLSAKFSLPFLLLSS